MASTGNLFASNPALNLGLSVDRNPGNRPDATRNILMLATDVEKYLYSNYTMDKNSQAVKVCRKMVSEKLEGACKPVPDCLINLPRNMEYTDHRLTGNDSAGRLFEDVIDLTRELKAKADRWDAHEAEQRLNGKNVQSNDIFTQNPTAAKRPYLDEVIQRFIYMRLRSRTYSLNPPPPPFPKRYAM